MWYVVWKTYSRLYRLHTFQTLTVEPEGLTYITWCTVGPTELVKAKWSTSEPHAEKQLVICTLLPQPPFHPNLWSYIPFSHFAVSSGAHHPLLLLIFASLHLATSKCCTAIQHFFSVSWLVLSLLFPALLSYQTKRDLLHRHSQPTHTLLSFQLKRKNKYQSMSWWSLAFLNCFHHNLMLKVSFIVTKDAIVSFISKSGVTADTWSRHWSFYKYSILGLKKDQNT